MILIKFIKFNITGIIVTIVGLILYYIFLKKLMLNIYLTYFIVFNIMTFISFTLNFAINTWNNLEKKDYLNYLSVYFTTWIFGFVIIIILKNFINDNFLIILIVVTVRTLINFN